MTFIDITSNLSCAKIKKKKVHTDVMVRKLEKIIFLGDWQKHFGVIGPLKNPLKHLKEKENTVSNMLFLENNKEFKVNAKNQTRLQWCESTP